MLSFTPYGQVPSLSMVSPQSGTLATNNITGYNSGYHGHMIDTAQYNIDGSNTGLAVYDNYNGQYNLSGNHVYNNGAANQGVGLGSSFASYNNAINNGMSMASASSYNPNSGADLASGYAYNYVGRNAAAGSGYPTPSTSQFAEQQHAAYQGSLARSRGKHRSSHANWPYNGNSHQGGASMGQMQQWNTAGAGVAQNRWESGDVGLGMSNSNYGSMSNTGIGDSGTNMSNNNSGGYGGAGYNVGGYGAGSGYNQGGMVNTAGVQANPLNFSANTPTGTNQSYLNIPSATPRYGRTAHAPTVRSGLALSALANTSLRADTPTYEPSKPNENKSKEVMEEVSGSGDDGAIKKA